MDKVAAYRTSDGTLFETEQAAKDHEFQITLTVWWEAQDFEADKATGAVFPDRIYTLIMADRMKLLPIFKLLNGGNPIVAPRTSVEQAA